MKSAEKYALRFSKAMKTLGRGDHKKLGAAFLRRYSAYLDSEEYKTFRDKYPSIGADKVYIGITFAEIMTKIGYTLDEALRVWEDVFMADKKRKINRLIRLIDTLGLGYKVASNWLDKDKQARDNDGSILYEYYRFGARELEYKIHTCAYVDLFERHGIRKFCKAFCNNDLCMCALRKSARFIRYSDLANGDCCHDKLVNLS